MAKRLLKAWLKDNPLTADKTDKMAVVSTNGNLTEDNLLDEIIAEGIEIKKDTLRSVITRYHNKVIDKVLSGFNVNIGIVYLRPVIKGPFFGKTWNPEINSVQINATAGAIFRKATKETVVEILGERADMIEIYTVTDNFTGQTDGTLTKGKNAELKGSYIKLSGEDPKVGITLHHMETDETHKLLPNDIVLNKPSRIIILVPNTLSAGEYELRITTQFTGGNNSLKQPRSVALNIPIVIE